MVHTFMLAPNF